MWNQLKNTQWDWCNLYFRFPKVFSHIHPQPSPIAPVLGYRQSGAHPRKMSWNIFLTKNKNHEESPAGSIKRTQVVYMALFSCQERCLWKWHAFHRKLWDSRACLAPRRHRDSQCCSSTKEQSFVSHSFRNIHWFPSLFQSLFQVWRI